MNSQYFSQSGGEVIAAQPPMMDDRFSRAAFMTKNILQRQKIEDGAFRQLAFSCALLVPITVVGILATLVNDSIPAFERFGLEFLTQVKWDPVHEEFGGLVAIYGTVASSLIAVIIAVPVSFGIALFLTELAPKWIRRSLGTAIELLAAIPSIIYGMWGLFVLAPVMSSYIQPALIETLGHLPILGPMFQGIPMGIGMLTAGVILAIMIIPFIASVMRDVFETVPLLLRESAYGIGATTWEVAWHITLPYSKVGVVGGIMLGLGRALGETMAVTFVIGNAHQLSLSLLSPGSTISSVLANEFTEAIGAIYNSSLIALGLILFMITLVVITISKLLLYRLNRTIGDRV
jgi:phosphate transport system permease protein